ncbi:MAG TPA: glutathione S-transferase family protein [Myxococcaceae bacterium]|jgi:glutathione S-transferase
MKLYFSPMTRSTRARWMLEELGQPYELVKVDMNKGEHKQAEYLKVHPLGLVPAFQDDGFTVFESAAIIMHLADKYPEKGLAPAVGTQERAEYYQWILFSMVEAEQPLVQIVQHTRFLPEADRQPSVVERASKKFKTVASVLQERLKGREYLIGNRFTAADVVLGGVMNFANMIGQLGEHPELQAYLKRLLERPAAKKALDL